MNAQAEASMHAVAASSPDMAGTSTGGAQAPRQLLVLGNWRLRHAEPVPPEQQWLRLVHLPPGARMGARAAQMDCRGLLKLVADAGPDRWREAGDGEHLAVANLDVHQIPLAIVSLAGPALADGLVLQALVDRTDLHGTHFLALPPNGTRGGSRNGPLIAPGYLWRYLAESFEAHHILTNNYECFYTTGAPPAPWRLVLEIPAWDVLRLGEDWLDHLVGATDATGAADNDGEAVVADVGGWGAPHHAHFVPQLGEEFQLTCHDNVACEVLPVAGGARGVVNAAIFSHKRRAHVLDGFAQVTAALTDADGGASTPRFNDERLTASPQEHLAACLELPLHAPLRWRRTAFVGHCESLASGHLFRVTFSINQSLDQPGVTAALCGIDYLKTRGLHGARPAEDDLKDLAAEVLRFLQQRHPRPDPYAQLPTSEADPSINQSPPVRRLLAAATL